MSWRRCNPHRNATHSGAGWIAAASLLWAGGSLVEKHLLLTINPVVLAFVVVCCAALSLLAFNRFAFKTLCNQFCMHPWLYLGLGLSGFALPYPFFYEALRHLPLGIAVCLIKLSSVFVIIFAHLFMHERLNWIQILAAIIAIVCALFIAAPIEQITNFHIVNGWAFAMAIVAAISFASATIFSKAILNRHVSPMHATTIRFIIGAFLLLPYLFISHNQAAVVEIKIQSWFSIAALGILFEAIAMVIYYLGMRYVSASLATLCELLQTIFSIFLGYMFLREILSWPQYLAIAILLGAIGIIAFQENRAMGLAEIISSE